MSNNEQLKGRNNMELDDAIDLMAAMGVVDQGKYVQALLRKCDEYEVALEAASIALNDWVVSYAPDFCDEEAIIDAASRVGKVGTLAYIAGVQEIIGQALAKTVLSNNKQPEASESACN